MKYSGDLSGRVFGQLTVLCEYNKGNNKGSSWLCRCSCGNTVIFEGNRLLSGHNKRCGHCNQKFVIYGDVVEWILPNCENFFFDFADLSLVSQYNWHIDAQGYPKSNGMHLHRLLMNPPDGMVVDHIDGDKLNNRRNNLRICKHSENLRNASISSSNTSGFKGVCFDKSRNKWSANITVNGKHHYLGRYDTPEEAAEEYDKAASIFYGKYARTNEMIRGKERKR